MYYIWLLYVNYDDGLYRQNKFYLSFLVYDLPCQLGLYR